jgi:hypothetical protein
MVRFSPCVLVALIVCALFPTRALLAEGERRSLGLVWDGIDGETTGAASWVRVYSDGKLAYRGQTRFLKPKIVEDIPAGRVTVVVSPKVCDSGIGFAGTTQADVAADGMTTVRVALTSCDGVRVSVTIRDIDGSPLTRTVGIVDITDTDSQLRCAEETSEDGLLSFVGYKGRTYRLVVNHVRPHIMTYTSKPIAIAKDMEPITWRLDAGPVLRLRFWLDGDAEPRRVEIPVINIRVWPRPKDGMAAGQWTVSGSDLVLSKSQGMLAGAKAIRLRYVPQGDDDEYVVTKNAHIALTDAKEQVADVVLAAKASGKIAVFVRGLADNKQLRLRAIHTDTGAEYGLSVADVTPVPTGSYRIHAWREGYRLATQEAAIVKDKTTSVTIEMQRAPVYRIQVLDHADNAVGGAAAVPIYPAELGIPNGGQQADRAGQVSVAIDDRFDVQLAIITSRMGAGVFALRPEWREEVGKLELAAPCEAAGEVVFARKLGPDVGEDGWRVMWVTAQGPNVVVYASEVIDGKYSVILQPGEYTPYLVQAHEAIALPSVRIKAGEVEKSIKRVEIDARRWRNRKPLWEHDIR